MSSREQAAARNLTVADVDFIRCWGIRTQQRNGNTRFQITERVASKHGRQYPELYAMIGATAVLAPNASVVTAYWYWFAFAAPHHPALRRAA
jgi:hypothetical protein